MRAAVKSLRLALLLVPTAIASIAVGVLPARAAPDVVRVIMTDSLIFQPRMITIKAGQTIEWRNESVLVHTVTADPAIAVNAEDVALPPGAKTFNSEELKPKASFRRTFNVPGTYRFFCIPHEAAGMVGEVIVTR